MSTTQIPIYVAGASSELERCEAFIAACDEAPWLRITHDWTREVRVARASGKHTDDALSDREANEAAEDDLGGVSAARLLVVLCPPPKTSDGMRTELGYALRCVHSDRTMEEIIIAGPHARSSIFTRANGCHIVDSDDAAFARLRWWRGIFVGDYR